MYLDYAANTPADPKVVKRFADTELGFFGNPNSKHRAGEKAKAEMAAVTADIAELLKVSSNEIIYTSGSTESNNTAIKGIVERTQAGSRVITTPLEHSSVNACMDHLRKKGYEVLEVKIDKSGAVDLEDLESLITENTVLFAVSAIDSETGSIRNIEDIKKVVKKHPDCMLHVDATQAIGKIDFDMEGCDTVSLSAHKFFGLNGSGLLVKRRHVKMDPLLNGGSSTTIFRSGTPTLALAAAMDEALKLALENLDERFEKVKELNRYLRLKLKDLPQVIVISPEDAVPHILNLAVDGIRGVNMQRMLDEKGIYVSVKSACADAGLPSRAVMALTGDRRISNSSFRVSLSYLTEKEELDELIKALKEILADSLG
ncbi:MAG: cysteine desulfurase [Lachnospiraceae bacterium]|nr:cysteine desulfurase [Lachnospiraceae bacterium]